MDLIEVEGQLVKAPRKGKCIEVNGNLYRMRRGKLVMIPKEWRGQIPTDQTMRKRGSHMIKKRRRDEKFLGHWKGTEVSDQLMLKNGAKSVE